jgi:receptor expression-enhancing protein 5/6
MESGGVGSSSAATDDVQWLTYWVAFSFLNILETFIGPVLSAIIPMYGFLKMGILVWMWYPSTRGAQTIYEQALRPLLLPYIETSTTTSSSKKE